MVTNRDAIRHLWTHKTQDHPWLADEDLVIERPRAYGFGPSGARSSSTASQASRS
jgi:hypothetical protein